MEDKLLDSTGRKIMALLAENARMSLAEIGRQVGLTPPAVAERIRKMEDAGVITGYHAKINWRRDEAAVLVFILLKISHEREQSFYKFAQKQPEIVGLYNVTGPHSFLIRAVLKSTAHLDNLLSRIDTFGQATTMVELMGGFERPLPDD